MSDNPSKRGEPDRSLIALGQAHEIAYWTKALGVSEAKLRKAVGAVGNSSVAVRAWLKKNP